MSEQDHTILDTLLSNYRFSCQPEPVQVEDFDLVHVFGTQEPVRSHPDARARSLLQLGWLHVEYIDAAVSLKKRGEMVSAIQQRAREWLAQNTAQPPEVCQQVSWLFKKTRSAESPQQLGQRVWLATVLYNLGLRGLAFNEEGEILYEEGRVPRIGSAPDAAIGLAWQFAQPVLYAASFRQADGEIWRGKGRQRWHIYRITLDPVARVLFEREKPQVSEKVALIVASDTHAKRPQLPRDFYGGDAFQQACIDAQDQQFDHILVLSPRHGVLSLDDIVTSDDTWQQVAETRPWEWGPKALQRLGLYLYGTPPAEIKEPHNVNWWAWLNPRSNYELTFFGSGFPVVSLANHVQYERFQAPLPFPRVVLHSSRPGYQAVQSRLYDRFDAFDEFDEDGFEGFAFQDMPDLDAQLQQDLEELFAWSARFAENVNVSFPPTGDEWSLTPEETIIPARLLALHTEDVDEVLDLLSDAAFALEHPISIHLLLNARAGLHNLLEIAHNVVHDDREGIRSVLERVPDPSLARYIETALQQPKREDRLCSLLTLAEPLSLLAMQISESLNQQLLVWLQTYLAGALQQHIRRQAGGDGDES